MPANLLTIGTMSSTKLLAFDCAYHTCHAALLSDGTVTLLDWQAPDLDSETLLSMARQYKVTTVLLTGPKAMYFPQKIKEITIAKTKRIEALAQGITFLALTQASLVVVIETGIHLFYQSDEVLYLGSLPYSFASCDLTENLAATTEMGEELPEPFSICHTFALHQEKSEPVQELLGYTISLAIKEFLQRYQIQHCYIANSLGVDEAEILQGLVDKATVELLPHAKHIACTGLLLPHLPSYEPADS